MKRFFKKWLVSLFKGEPGFTLVELLVVVGIIVALAAVIIPNVASFSSKGKEGAQAAELENVQTAMDTMLADQGIAVVDAQDLSTTSNGIQNFTSEPTGTGAVGLSTYLRNATTTYWYCWDGAGKVSEQLLASGLCTK